MSLSPLQLILLEAYSIISQLHLKLTIFSMNHKVTKFGQKNSFREDKISRLLCSMFTILVFQLTGTVAAHNEM